MPERRRALLAVGALFLLTLGVRLLAVYPPTLRHDPATIALQACRILDGERPIFWAGQAWMGTAGTYVEAALFHVFGANSLVMSLYAWALAGLWIALSLALAWRLFGPPAAVGAAALWLVPTPALLYWSSQARNDFQVFFVATPLILLLAHDLVLRHRRREPIAGRALLTGFVCGFSFWQNMAIGPCVVAAVAVLALQLGGRFWTRVLPLFAPAWLAGFSPVLHYNLTADLAVRGQAALAAPRAVADAAGNLVTNALPHFWGMPPQNRPAGAGQALQVFFLAWTLLLLCVYAGTVYRRWRRREDLLADQLVVGLVLAQLLVPTLTRYGASFATRGNPILFITNLYTAAFVIVAVALTRVAGVRGALLALPLLIYVGNNVRASADLPRAFFTALRERGAGAIHRFPDPAHPLIGLLAGKGLAHGYLDSMSTAELNLAGLHRVEFARPFNDRIVDYVRRADAADEIFWFSQRGLPDGFAMIGASFETEALGRDAIYHGFRRSDGTETLLEGAAVSASAGSGEAAALTDRDAGTVWSLPSPLSEASITFAFPAAERVDRVTLVPVSDRTLPPRLAVQRSLDGLAWETVDEWREAGTFFWSVRHPFLKLVKPRCELALSRPGPARFLRLLVPQQGGEAAFREIYLHRVDPPAAATPLDEEIGAIAREIAPLKRTHLIVGDHYFMSLFEPAGFDVEFVTNRSVNNYGRLNPHLAELVPVDFSRPAALIVPKSHGASVARSLAAAGVPSRRREFARHDLFVTAPAAGAAPLWWSGFDLLRIASPR